MGDDLRDVADGFLLLPGLVLAIAGWLQQFTDVFIPDFLHFAALSALALLLRGNKRHQFIAHALVGDLCDLVIRWQIRAREIAEVARDEDACGEQALGRIRAAELGGAFLQTIHQPKALAHRHRDAEELAESADVVVVELRRRGIGERDDVIEAHHGFAVLREVHEHLVVDLHGEVLRHRFEFLAKLCPITGDKAQLEAVVGGQRRGIIGADAFEMTQEFIRIAREFLLKDRLEFFDELRVWPRRLSGNWSNRQLSLRGREEDERKCGAK